MPNVVTPKPDFKVFFRRLLVPGELGADPSVTLSPSQISGTASQPDQTRTIGDQIKDTFRSYQPAEFRGQVISKAARVADDYRGNLALAEAAIPEIKQQITIRKKQLTAIPAKITRSQASQLNADAAYYASTVGSAGNFVAFAHSPTAPSPIDSDSPKFRLSLNNIQSILSDVGEGQPAVTNLLVDLAAVLNVLITQTYVPIGHSIPIRPTAVAEDDFRQALASELNQLIGLIGITSESLSRMILLENQIGALEAKLQDAQSDLAILKKSSAIQPFYEPILLDCLIGPYSTSTSMNRMGQPGTGSVSFHLPLSANGQAPDLFFGFQVGDAFNLSNLESMTASAAAKTGLSIPSKTLSILTANLRETTIQPFDMMQIWARRRLSVSAVFPGDYYPIFTGFVTKTTVSYSSSTVAVKVDGEDVGKMVRLARTDVNPSLDLSLNSLHLNISAFVNNLVAGVAQPNLQTGGDMVRNVIKGQSGSFLGMSTASFITTTALAGSGPAQTLVSITDRGPTASRISNVPSAAPSPDALNAAIQTLAQTGVKVSQSQIDAAQKTTGGLATQVVNLAWDFKNILVNVFDDVANNWPVYTTQLKSAFRMWEVDEMTKWEVCSQIAETQEFEFYADNMGVINYHPPFYCLNPFAPQYYIENVDIISESHAKDEKEITTVMELDTQPSFFANASVPNPILQGRSFVSASTPILQRYAVRYAKKSSPIFSDTTTVPPIAPGKSDDRSTNSVEVGRTAYARALLNRRNARLLSATVTINGTPELRLCNTVAFIGDMGSVLHSVNPGGKLPQDIQNVLVALRQVLVYYISGIGHSYTQGKDFTTTLSLTHGRHWTDAVPQGGVGYGLGGKDTDDAVSAMKNVYGQKDPLTDTRKFISMASAYIQFIATGDPALIAPMTNSQFGFSYTPVKPSALKKFETQLSGVASSAIARVRAWYCNPQSTENDPKKSVRHIRDEKNNIVNAIGKALSDAETAIGNAAKDVVKFFKNIKGKSKKFLLTYEQKLKSAVEQAALKLAMDLNNPEVMAFQAFLGGKNFKIVKSQTFDSGQALKLTGASTYLAPIQSLGIDTSAITSFQFPLVALVYAARSSISLSDAKLFSEKQVMKDMPNLLKNTLKGVPLILLDVTITSTTGMKHASGSLVPAALAQPSLSSALSGLGFSGSTTALSASQAPASGQTPKPSPEQSYYVLGLMVAAIKPTC